MAVLPIVLLPDPILRKRAEPVERVDDTIRQLMDDMLETMYDAPGIGLAAPQIGISKRIIVMDCSDDEVEAEPIGMINPEILTSGDDTCTIEEGCLSIPGHRGDVTRPASIEVRYLDRDGAVQELSLIHI